MKSISKVRPKMRGKAGTYSIKFKVIGKETIRRALEDKTLDYQIITFQDEEGTKLRTVLFNESLSEFGNTMEDEMEYKITNARIEMLHALNTENTDDLVYRLHFNMNTIVDRLPYQPKYLSIASIPRTVSLDDRYDILGIVIYVDTNCKITRPDGQNRDICEVIIFDQSYDQIMIVTAWEEEAIEECKRIQDIAVSYPVIGFTAVRSAYRKGFSLSFTHKTSITIEPHGKAADELRAWRQANEELLADKSYKVFQVRHPNSYRNIITMEQLLQKKAKDTLQEEHHWLYVQLSGLFVPNLSLYHGCSSCGTGNYEQLGVAYNCHDCITEGVISSPRMSITFEAGDQTGTYIFTAVTENAEKMLDVAVADLYSMHPQEKEHYLIQIIRQLRNTPFYIQGTPSIALSIKQELLWVLQHVSLT